MNEAPGADGWLLPPGARRPARLLPLGTLGGGGGPVVDDRGLVTPGGEDGGWSVDWWVAAEDRWHLPAAEAGVRQSLLNGSPVVETRQRIPGGDAVQRTYGFVARDGSERVVVEVANDSAVPVAVALAVRPFGPTGPADMAGPVDMAGPAATADLRGPGGVGRLGLLADERTVTRDGEPVIVLPRRPAGATWSAGDGADIVAVVTGGTAPFLAPTPAGHPDPSRRATAAFVFPLPHRQALRFLLALPGSSFTAGAAGAVPSAQQVAKGWTAQADRGPRFELPDPLAAAVAVARRRLMLWGADVELAPALDQLGLHDDVEAVLASMALPGSTFGGGQPAAAYLVSLATHLRLTANFELVAASADSIAAAVATLTPARRSLRRRRRTTAGPGVPEAPKAMAAAAELFDALGDGRAAADARRVAGELGPSEPVGDGPDVMDLDPLAPAASTTELRRLAFSTIGAVRQLLVDDVHPRRLDLLPGWSPRWYGQALEVHDLPTAAGRLSFALRWHGTRPALLWDLQDRAGPVELRSGALDPSWRVAARRGEALLAECEPPAGGDLAIAQEPTSAGFATSAQPPVSVWSIVPPSDPAGSPPAGQPEEGSFS